MTTTTRYPGNVRWLRYGGPSDRFRAWWNRAFWVVYTSAVVTATVASYTLFQFLF